MQCNVSWPSLASHKWLELGKSVSSEEMICLKWAAGAMQAIVKELSGKIGPIMVQTLPIVARMGLHNRRALMCML